MWYLIVLGIVAVMLWSESPWLFAAVVALYLAGRFTVSAIGKWRWKHRQIRWHPGS